MKNYQELEGLVIEWGRKKGILQNGTPTAQCLKTIEEVNELELAIENNDRDEIEDALGDILVTIIIQAEMQGLSLESCLESAYNVISKRTGKMENGQFVKDVYDEEKSDERMKAIGQNGNEGIHYLTEMAQNLIK